MRASTTRRSSARGRAAESLDELVRRTRPELCAYLMRLLGNADDAEDACQDALLRAHRAYPRLTHRRNLRAWLFAIATRSGLNHRRRLRRSIARTAADVDPELLPAPAGASPAQRAKVRHVLRAVESLPPKQRAALMQRQFHGLTYDEIGAAIGCSGQSARANVYQAIKRLRALLTEDET